MLDIRSVSFDTSFLLKNDPDVELVLKKLKRAGIECYVTSTVVTELDALRLNYRIDEDTYRKAMKRWHRVNAKVIDFKNRLLSGEFIRKCQESMGEHHGVGPDTIVNDCKIIVVGLKKGVDLFLSEDFHFTSKITDSVLKDITNNACKEYHQMCDEELYSVDTKTFLEAFQNGKLDLDVINERRKNIKKSH
jgi:hypothetical protein